jgi:hypothetical protein
MFEKPKPFEFTCNRKSILETLADFEVSGIKNPKEEFVGVVMMEILDRLYKEVPELKIKEIKDA